MRQQSQPRIQQVIMNDRGRGVELNLSTKSVEMFENVVLSIFYFFNLFFSVFHRSRSWHLFSNPVLPGLLVGCQWVIEPILSPLLNKLIAHGWS